MSRLQHIRRIVAQLKPGESIRVDLDLIRGTGMYYNGGAWRPADMVLEGVIGSAYGWSYTIDPCSLVAIFSRRAVPDGARTYISPDRTEFFFRDPDGLWRPRSEQTAEEKT